jgi:uncharacterized protein (DUF2141 family)
MKGKRIYSLFVKLLSLLVVAGSVNYCANPVPPTGGPIDKDPPKVEVFLPPNKTVNFRSPEVELVFDEYIQFQSSGGAVIISPPLNPEPTFTLKGKKLNINFKDNLLPNTTYTINFGTSIKDINEGNQMEGLVYIFSTGPFLDSLSLSGKVINAFDKSGAEGVMVALYDENQDSILIKNKPYYFSKTDAQGNFIFNYLKDGNYQIAAVDDKNMNYLFDSATEKVAFTEEVVEVIQNTKLSNPLVLFKDEEKIKATEVKNKKPGLVTIAFNRAVDEILIDANIFSENDLAFFNQTNDTLFYWYTKSSDTAKFFLTIGDYPTDTQRVKLSAIDTSLRIELGNIKPQVPENQSINLKFDFPISEFFQDSIVLVDSAEAARAFAVEKISERNFSVKGEWSTGEILSLQVKEGAFIDFVERKNKEIKQTITIADKELPPNLFLTIKSNREGVFYLQLLNDQKMEIKNFPIGNNESLDILNVKHGKYFVRVFEDLNGNGKWDRGKYSERRQPEPTVFFSPQIELRPNWDNDLTIEIN